MKLSPFLGLLYIVVAGPLDRHDDVVTVTVTRTHTICPWQTIDFCDTTEWYRWSTTQEWYSNSEATTWPEDDVHGTSIPISTSTSSSASLRTTTTTSSSSSSITSQITTSPLTTTTSATTTSSYVPGTVSNPGQSFLPSAEIGMGNLAKRAIVYIDMSNPDAGKLTTDRSLAISFSISATGTLETTLRSYPNICGTEIVFNNTPGRFYCDNSGALPHTFTGWTNSPIFTYKNWSFCYKWDLSLYLSPAGGTSGCTAVTFAADFSANT